MPAASPAHWRSDQDTRSAPASSNDLASRSSPGAPNFRVHSAKCRRNCPAINGIAIWAPSRSSAKAAFHGVCGVDTLNPRPCLTADRPDSSLWRCLLLLVYVSMAARARAGNQVIDQSAPVVQEVFDNHLDTRATGRGGTGHQSELFRELHRSGLRRCCSGKSQARNIGASTSWFRAARMGRRLRRGRAAGWRGFLDGKMVAQTIRYTLSVHDKARQGSRPKIANA